MSNPMAIAKLFTPELSRIRDLFGDGYSMAVLKLIDRHAEAEARKSPGSAVALDVDWDQIHSDIRTHQAVSAGQKVAEARAAEAEADVIRLTPDGLARIVAAARTEPGTETTDLEYSNYGETGKVTRLTRHRSR